MIVTVSPFVKEFDPSVNTGFKIKADLVFSTKDGRPGWRVHTNQLTLAGCVGHVVAFKGEVGYIILKPYMLKPADKQGEQAFADLMLRKAFNKWRIS